MHFKNIIYLLGSLVILACLILQAESNNSQTTPQDIDALLGSLDSSENVVDDSNEDFIKRSSGPVPKLRRIFIGKRFMADDDDDDSNDYFVAKRGPPRRHLFIGKRDNLNKKSGRVHRIFIG